MVNGKFHRVHLAGGFRDPNLPHGYAPFNIQNIGGRLFVAYAKQDSAASDEIAGNGLGFVDVYSRRGFLMHRIASRGALNAPWGLVQAPGGFGRFGHALLVGNFGNGMINAYNIRTGKWLGELRRPNGHAVQIDGLWGLRFGNGVTGDRNVAALQRRDRRRGPRPLRPDPRRPLAPRRQPGLGPRRPSPGGLR